jgi:PAS domain S-box-containing protein
MIFFHGFSNFIIKSIKYYLKYNKLMGNNITSLKNHKILIVEDEGLPALELKNKLKEHNYEILPIASSGEEAIETSLRTKPNLILMDIMLKGEINGIEAAKEIKKFLDIPIIYITAYGDEETLQNAKVTEPHSYILKPFEDKEVRYAMEIALYKHEMELKLKEEEKKYRSLYYKAPVAYQLLNKEGYITEVNQAWLDVLGYEKDEVINQYLGNFLISNDYHKFKENWDYYKDLGCQKTEFIMLCSDGSHLPVEFEIKSIYEENRDLKQILCIFYIISHHKDKQDKIKESLIRKEMLLEEISLHLQNNYNKILNLTNSEFREIKEKNVEHKEDIILNEIKNEELEIFQDEFAFVDFAQYVESLVEDLICSYNLDPAMDISLNIDNVLLDLNTSLSYGLILNELLKNSINNHLLNGKFCIINVDFHLDNNRFILTISDNCNNYLKMLKSQASSYKLINTLVKQHQGTIGFDENKMSEIKIIFGIGSKGR